MKKLSIFLMLLPAILKAQVYPFSENFSSYFADSIPTGWGGYMKVYLAHGVNDSKALVAKMSGASNYSETITPLIGPLTSTSALSFNYRLVQQNIYPSTEAHLDTGGRIVVQVMPNDTTFIDILTIDQTNHVASLNFALKKIPVHLVGQSVRFRFVSQCGPTIAYYFDLDEVEVKDYASAAISEIESENSFNVYPNPCREGLRFNVSELRLKDQDELSIFNAEGTLVFHSALRSPHSALPPGIYFVQIGNVTRKLIVQP